MHLADGRNQAGINCCKLLRFAGSQYAFNLHDWRMATPFQLSVDDRSHFIQQLMEGAILWVVHRMARGKRPGTMMVSDGFPVAHADQDRFPSALEKPLRDRHE